ncbi:LOW QUALITY PROTEIN: hypothetical protein HID58_089147 [Brassica napus]|uniref:Uncharacterized protein n=1 Tax=Brassica napus TaxID=3708 RepID=A0ABQ7XYA9_BRANA|nr:LOW QUALITY PROTEIN: hypothetical protein HID58_089147 [Brassica napus]
MILARAKVASSLLFRNRSVSLFSSMLSMTPPHRGSPLLAACNRTVSLAIDPSLSFLAACNRTVSLAIDLSLAIDPSLSFLAASLRRSLLVRFSLRRFLSSSLSLRQFLSSSSMLEMMFDPFLSSSLFSSGAVHAIIVKVIFDSVHLLYLSLSLHGERKNIGLCNSQEEGCDCALTVRKRDVQIEKMAELRKKMDFVQSRLKNLMRFIEHKIYRRSSKKRTKVHGGGSNIIKAFNAFRTLIAIKTE